VLSNVLAAAISDPADVTHFYEIGSGKVLAGLAKRIDPSVRAVSIGLPADINAALAQLNS
jgi:[acyl-carrier-protein] S-malonyltransferase